jgi:DNA-binding transcriptional regulator PaaX
MSFVDENTSLKDFLIAFLSSAKNTRRFHQILKERALKNYKVSTIRNTLSRLHRSGLVSNNRSEWNITPKGSEYYNKQKLFQKFESPFTKNNTPNTLVAFDIPEIYRMKRQWLRGQLKIYGYTMVQQSLWYGPGPIPKECLDKFRELEIKKNIKIFKITLKN